MNTRNKEICQEFNFFVPKWVVTKINAKLYVKSYHVTCIKE